MNKLWYINLLFLCIFIFNSCQKYQLEVHDWSPELVSPLINTTITIADLIPEQGTTEYDNDNLIHLAFRSDSIYILEPSLIQDITGLNIDTIVTLEQLLLGVQDDPALESLINLLGLEIPFPESQEIPGALFSLFNADLIEPFNFQFDEFNNATFNSGNLEITIINNLPVALENTLIIINPSEDIEWQVNISELLPGQGYNHTIDLAGLTIESSNSMQIEIETLEIENLGTDMLVITPQTGFSVLFNLNNVGFDNITLPLGGDTVDVDLALFEDFDSGLILENPQFTLKVDNPFGLVGNIDGQLLAFSQYGIQESLNVNLDIEPNNISTVTYYQDVIGDIIALPPQILEYEANASLSFNIDDIVSDQALKLGVDIDFPLSVNAANLSLKDTIVFDGIQYDISKLERLLLHYNLINGFPLGTRFNLVLHDSINPSFNLDTLEFIGMNTGENNIINPAIVNDFGEVIEPVLSSGVLILSDSEISNLLNTNKMIIDVTLSSSNFQNQDQYVKIYSDYECILKLGIETQLNIDLD
ncbi:MAG: hypothetical protein CMP49_03580 [Flavobacteriales bacterium]|nr:hypothetical protein [Flavobacteriales bacterium]|tara:strand:- start:7825 stop:9417 length:1593 start_codon:yes stop_codon:yes gene_type:complete